MDEVPADCRDCAACCFSESPRHVRVFGIDHERLGDDAERLLEHLENQSFMRLVELAPGVRACAALAIDPKRGTFACSIYEKRPDVCRSLDRGTGLCAAERHAKADRPRRVLAVLRQPT
jgi:hypothetical protein